jgi:hypothetical protein
MLDSVLHELLKIFAMSTQLNGPSDATYLTHAVRVSCEAVRGEACYEVRECRDIGTNAGAFQSGHIAVSFPHRNDNPGVPTAEDRTWNRDLPDAQNRLALYQASLFSGRVHSGLLDVSQISGDKYVFLFRATHSILRTAASRAQYVESTPANQTIGSCASLVITKGKLLYLNDGPIRIGTGELSKGDRAG